CGQPLNKKRTDLWLDTKPALNHQPSIERMTIMDCHSSATARSEAPHATETESIKTISDALKRRAQSVINNRSIDTESRALVRYALEINDPCLADIVRRADAGESIVAALERSEISDS